MTDGQEDVIRRRLLIDGDGTGDDRRLNLLHKSFIKWTASDPTPAESEIMKDRMLAQLAQCEYAFKKSRMVAKMSSSELQNHESFAQKIYSDVEKAKEDIERIKEELEEAKIVHNNQLEYEVLANTIKEHPARKKTDEELTQIKKELHSLEEKRNELDSKLDSHRNQCHTLIASINRLQSLLETNESTAMDSSILDYFDDDDMDLFSGIPETNAMETSPV